MNRLELKPTFTSSGALVLAIGCGLFFSVISYLIFSGNGDNPLAGLIVSAVSFTVVVVLGVFMGRGIFKTKKILLEENKMTVFLQGNKKDVIDLSQIQKATFVEDRVSAINGDIDTHISLGLIDSHGQGYALSLDGFIKVNMESLLSYLTSHQKSLILSRIELFNGVKTNL